jgi:hypothetical protein
MALTEHEKEIIRQLDRQFTCSPRDRLGRFPWVQTATRTISRVVRSRALLIVLLLVILALLTVDLVLRATESGPAPHALPASTMSIHGDCSPAGTAAGCDGVPASVPAQSSVVSTVIARS